MISINKGGNANPWDTDAEFVMDEIDTQYSVDVGGISAYLQFRNKAKVPQVQMETIETRLT